LPHTKLLGFQPKLQQTYFGMPTTVNFVTQSYTTTSHNNPDSARLEVLATLVQNEYLHKEIREKGGAYGSGVSHIGGTFSFYSYRDPKLQETIDNFKNSLQWILTNKFTNENLDEAKMMIFAHAPVPPSRKGLDEFLYGITHEIYLKHCKDIMAVTKQDIIQVTEKYLTDKPASVVVLGKEQDKNFMKNKQWVYRVLNKEQ